MAPHPYYCQNLPIQALKFELVFEMVVTDGMATIIVFFLLLFNEHQLSMNKEKRDGGKENERRKEKIK